MHFGLFWTPGSGSLVNLPILRRTHSMELAHPGPILFRLTLDCGQHPGHVNTTRWLVLATTITPQRTQNPLTAAVVPVLQFSQHILKTPRLGNCSSVIVGRSRPTSLESHVNSQNGAKIDISKRCGHSVIYNRGAECC